MSVNAGVPFNEAGAGPADFAAVPTVLPNSDVLSADVNQLVEAALRRTRYLFEKWIVCDDQSSNAITTVGAVLYTVTAGAGYASFGAPEITVLGCLAGDVLEINASCIGDYVGGTGASLRLRVSENDAGTPSVVGVPFAFFVFPPGSTFRRETNVSIRHTIATGGNARVYFEGTADATNLGLTTQFLFSVRQLRDHT